MAQMMAEIHRLQRVVDDQALAQKESQAALVAQQAATAAAGTTAAEPVRRPRPALPDISLFSGRRTDYLVWSLSARQKLLLDEAALGGAHAAYAYLFTRMDTTAQNLVASRFQQGLANPDPLAFFQYLDTVFLDPNAADRAMSKLQTIRQGNTESFAIFIPRFERLLHEANLYDDRASISILSQALLPRLRHALVTCDVPTTYQEYISLLFRVSSRLEEAQAVDRQQRWSVASTATPNADAMDWQPETSVRSRAINPQPARNLTHGPQPRLTPELREKLVATGACFKCRRTGHRSPECPSTFRAPVTVNQVHQASPPAQPEEESMDAVPGKEEL